MTKGKKKLSWSVIPLILLMFFSIHINGVMAYTPQTLYDQVWVLINNKYVNADNNGQQWTKWRHKYDNVIKTDADAYVAIDTMVTSLNDPYTRFLTPEAFAEEGQSISGKLKGIGVQIGLRDGKLLVVAPIEDTPAMKAGLKANDEILQIDNASTKGISIKDAADKIRGEEGTSVKLIIKRDGKEITFNVVRAEIELKSVSTTPPVAIPLSDKVGYIRLNSFLSRTASNEFLNALKQEENKQGYIIDLRSNPGGLLTNALIIANMFYKDDVIVSTVDRDGYKETERAGNKYITDKPVIILINEGSASASEIFSGAMKDNGRAVLVGTKSFGKGLVQEINKLQGGAGINITTQKYLTPNGTDINKKGIIPDIEVPLTEADIKNKKDPQLEKAQETLLKMISGNNEEKVNSDKNSAYVKVLIK